MDTAQTESPGAPAVTLDDVKAAAERIKGAVVHTPFLKSQTLSEMIGAEVYLKFEIFQFTAAFKERGALNKLLTLTDDERKRGVVAMSAGNHAQAVAYHAGRLNIRSTIVMPEGTPNTKVHNTQRFGAEVVVRGKTLSEASAIARTLEKEQGLVFVHPYDDPAVIAGQGTIGIECLEAEPDLDMLAVPIGGGGLISGIATAAKGLKPDIRVFGVQTELYPSMKAALAGQQIAGGGTSVAEGIAVKEPGMMTREIVRRHVEDILVVSERRIEDAINTLLEIEKVVAEGAGAASLAALMEWPTVFEGQKVGVILCGGNIDTRLLATAIMRGLARDGRIARLRILIPDIPGMFASVSTIIANHQANILEVEHQRQFADINLKQAELNVVVETRDRSHTEELVSALEAAGHDVVWTGAAVHY